MNIDEYIDSFPVDIKNRLNLIREVGSKIMPDAIQKMAYGMPTFKMKKNIFHFAVSKNHIGIYPGPNTILKLDKELKKYGTSKGAIRFLHSEDLPILLIEKIVRVALDENNR